MRLATAARLSASVLLEGLHDPLAGVSIPLDDVDAVPLELLCVFADHVIGTERRAPLAHEVEHDALTLRMGDAERERVGAAKSGTSRARRSTPRRSSVRSSDSDTCRYWTTTGTRARFFVTRDGCRAM
jgi:hypothetical protein